MPKSEFVSLKLFNLDGTLRSEVVGRQQAAGSHSLSRSEMKVDPGIYLAVFKAGAISHSTKVVLAH